VISTVVGMATAMVLIGMVSEDPVEPAAGAAPAKVAEHEEPADQSNPVGRPEWEHVEKNDAGQKAKMQRPRKMVGVVQQPATTYVVSRVVDGDTLELGTGDRVQLVGIDSPDQGECGYEQARATLAAIVEGERITLTGTDHAWDGDGRLTGYVDVGTVDAGLQLVEDGLATVRNESGADHGSHPREAQYVVADLAAPDLVCGAS
jgi:endonuclease YncB( thermonuclease family)